MRGVCETCDQVSDVLQLAGRNDLICAECYVNIGTAIQLYQTLCEVERAGGDTFELEGQLKLALRRLFSRARLDAGEASASTRLRSSGRPQAN